MKKTLFIAIMAIAGSSTSAEAQFLKQLEKAVQKTQKVAETINSQLNPGTTTNNEKVFDVVEQMPSFPGGQEGLMRYLSDNVKYPAEAEQNGIQGRSVISFVVERDGSVSQPTVVRSSDALLDKEAVRVVAAMPKWIPGRHNGEAVRVKYTVPITFKQNSQTKHSQPQQTATVKAPFTVPKCKAIKFVKVTAKGVNLRKSPNAQSPRLVWEESEIGDFFLTWINGSMKAIHQPINPEALAVIGESGDWYKVSITSDYDTYEAYIMKKFCQDATLRSITPEDAAFISITSGPYAGYFVNFYEVEGGFGMDIGKAENGMLLVARTCSYYGDTSASTTTIDNGNITFSRQYTDQFGIVNAKKVIADSALMKRIMDSCDSFTKAERWIFGVTGKSGVFTF